MTTDTDLRSVLTTEAGGPTTAPGGWDDVVRRGRHRQRVRRAQRGALAALAVGAVVTGVALSGSDPELETTPPATDPTTTLPDATTDTTMSPPVAPDAVVRAARVQGAFVTVIIPAADPTTSFDPCVDRHPSVAESGAEVVVELVDANGATGEPWAQCQSSPFSGWATIELTDPLGDRRLIDAASGSTVLVIDGGSLLFPTELPDDFDPQVWDENGYEGSWTFTWMAAPTDVFVNVTTGYRGTECEHEPVEVRGTAGRLCAGSFGHFSLHWEEGGRTISIEMGATDPESESGFTVEDVLAVAEGLEPLGG